MRKSILLAIALFVAIATVSFGIPFPAHLEADAIVQPRTPATPCDLSYRLNEDATTATVEIYGPLPGTTVIRTIAGGTDRGLNTVVWDGKDDSEVEVTAGENYGFRVIVERDPGHADWTEISPMSFNVEREWVQDVTESASNGSNGNDRGIAYEDANDKLIITGTDPRHIAICDPADGTFVDDIALNPITDPYGMGFTVNDLDGWLGPYDLSRRANDGRVFLGPFLGDAPITLLDSTSTGTLIGVTAGTAYSRVCDVANNNVLYWSYYGDGVTRVCTSDDGTTYGLLENLGTANMSHNICAKHTNTGGDGDVVWGSAQGAMERWVRSGGAWAQDGGFSCSFSPTYGSDYASIGGKDTIVAMDGDGGFAFIDGDTGETLGTYQLPESRVFWAANGDVCVVETGANTGVIYYMAAELRTYGKLTYGYGALGDLCYGYQRGIESIKDKNSPLYGATIMCNGYDGPSVNPGAKADKQGIWLNYNDGVIFGGSAAASWAAAMNDPAAPWDSGDSWSPFSVHQGVEDGLYYVGDYGTMDVSDALYTYDFQVQAKKLLAEGGSGHGRVVAANSVTSNGVRTLLGVHRDSPSGSLSLDIWSIGATEENYTGGPTNLIAAPNGYGLTDLWSMYDIDMASDGMIYAANSRWGAAETRVFGADWDVTTTATWRKTGTDINAAIPAINSDGQYFRKIAVDEVNDRVAALCPYNYISDGNWCVIFDRFNGDIITGLNPLAGTGDYYYILYAVGFDPVGNVYIGNRYYEETHIYSPPGASTETTDYIGQIYCPTDEVEDWMVY